MKRKVILGALVVCGVLISVTASAQAVASATVQKDIEVTATVPHVVDLRIVQGQDGINDDNVPLNVDEFGKIQPRDVNVTVHSNHLTQGVNVKLMEDPQLAHEDAKQKPIPLTVKLDEKTLDKNGHSLTRSDIVSGESIKTLKLSITPDHPDGETPAAGNYSGKVKVSVSPAS